MTQATEMARHGHHDADHGGRKSEDHISDEEEEESLSLCDLPISQEEKNQQTPPPPSLEEAQDFEFGSLSASVLTESEICAADDVFFQGQILPWRLSSVSSSSRNPISRNGSRSDSMEHCSSSSSSSGGFTSLSSRSSSIKSLSHQSSSSSSTSNSSIAYERTKALKNNFHFHSHPSPKPQVWFSGSRPRNVRNRSGGRSTATTWGLFRVGLVRTPEIELEDLKLRNNKSFKSSSTNSTNSNSSSSSNNIINNGGSTLKVDDQNNGSKLGEKKKMQRFLFESCKCSVDAVESVSSRITITKNNGGGGGYKKKINADVRENKGEVKEEEKGEKQGSTKHKSLNHRRTFEWLKELSIAADVPD